MLWFLSIFTSIFVVFFHYYAAYKKLFDGIIGVRGFAVIESITAGFVWGLAISIQNMNDIDLNMSTDEELMIMWGPGIIIAIIHFIILFPAYFVYKDDNTK